MRKAKFSRQVTFSMSEATYEGVKLISDKAEVSVGEWLRIAVVQALESTQKTKDGGQI